MLPSMVRPSASCTHRRWFFFLHKQTDVENCLFWVLLPRDRRASRTVDTGQRERSSVLVRSSADAALRSMDRCNKRTEWWNRRNQVNVVSASRWHFRQKKELDDVSADSSFYSIFIYLKTKTKMYTAKPSTKLLFFKWNTLLKYLERLFTGLLISKFPELSHSDIDNSNKNPFNEYNSEWACMFYRCYR